jgi:hypothetical protein
MLLLLFFKRDTILLCVSSVLYSVFAKQELIRRLPVMMVAERVHVYEMSWFAFALSRAHFRISFHATKQASVQRDWTCRREDV